MLETKRLRLDLPVPEHAPLMAHAYKNSQQELQEFMIWAQKELTLENAEEFIESQIDHETDITFFPIDKETGRFIGSFSLMLDKEAVPSYEIGYWVNTELTGNGYATEVVHELVKYAFEELGAKRLTILTDLNNIASEKIAEKCGFEYEGIARNGAAYWDETGAIDVKVYSLIPKLLMN